MIGVGIGIFPRPGIHYIALESDFRPYWPQTSHSHWTFRAINLDVRLWALHNLLGISAKVSAPVRPSHN